MRSVRLHLNLLAVIGVLGVCPLKGYGFEPPVIPVGVWYSSKQTDSDYVRKVARSLKEHHFNTVVANDSFTLETVNIFAEAGIAVITREGNFLDHPAVIASVVGGAPAPGVRPGNNLEALSARYQELRAKTDKPLITCVAGDGLGVETKLDPWQVWKSLEPKVRCLSWYGIARGHHGILHRRLYLGYVSYSSVLRMANSGKGSFWIVLPGFGMNDTEAEHQNPSSAQVKGMMHLAAAYGARGILLWSLQNHEGWQCLVNEETLEATDEKYAAASNVAGVLQEHGDLIRSLQPRGGDLRCPNSYIDAVGQHDKNGRRFIYAVNKNTKESVSTSLLSWGANGLLSTVRDVFNKTDLKLSPKLDEEGYQVIPLNLLPGEGKLIDFGGGKKGTVPDEESEVLASEDEGAIGQHDTDTLKRLLERKVSRKQGAQRTRKLLAPWLSQDAKWQESLLGGTILVDGKIEYQGRGKLIGAYENEVGAFGSWYEGPEQRGSGSAARVFVTCGVTDQPRRMAFLVVDVLPGDRQEHTFEIRLPMSPGLEQVRTLTCDLSPKRLESVRGNSDAANKLFMRHFKYFELYPRGRANYCADTVMSAAPKGTPGWLISRIIEPRGGTVFPAQYQKTEKPGATFAPLTLSTRSKELHLKMLFFVEDAPADQEPLVYTVPSAANEIRLASAWYLKFRTMSYGRTVFTLTSPSAKLAVGSEDDKTVEMEMVELDEN